MLVYYLVQSTASQSMAVDTYFSTTSLNTSKLGEA